MRPVDSLQAIYDSTPYRDQFFHEFDLARLLGFAELFGVRKPGSSPSGLRVLDLGCATGVHLRRQASRYPHVQFTGIDFSHEEIELGQKEIATAGLENVDLITADLREVEIESGEFDLIVSHSIFSWVPDEVKERILLLCRQGLKSSGLAAIAYLTYPGWKQREAIRELLMMRVHKQKNPEERIRDSALLLRLLHAGYSAYEHDAHAQSLKAHVESMQKSSANAFGHDELGQVHDPCYFLQFAEWAAECGLEYLAETDLGTRSAEGLDVGADGLLRELSPDFLETQQLIDFIMNRSGRSSLLVRDDTLLTRSISTESLGPLAFGTSWWNVTPMNAARDAPARFESHAGRSFQVENPCIRWILTELTSVRDGLISYATLETGAARDGHTSMEFGPALLSLVAKGIVEPRSIID